MKLLLPYLSLVAGLYSRSSHCWAVKSFSLTAGSNRPEPATTCHCQVSTANPGSVIAPSLSDSSLSTTASTSTSDVLPSPSQAGHMPSAVLKLKAEAVPTYGSAARLKMMRSMVCASVAVPTVERALAPMRSWSTMIAALRLCSASTSGRDRLGMKPWTNAVYVSSISRLDSAAIVSKTSEDLPEPDTPVKTVSRRFGMSRETPLRLFSRAPRTWMWSWLSAAV